MKKLKVLLSLSLLVFMLSSCNNYTKPAEDEVSNTTAEMKANTVYVFTTYQTSKYSFDSFEMYTYPDAKVTQYDYYFVVEYEKDGSTYKETFSNSAFGYSYKE